MPQAFARRRIGRVAGNIYTEFYRLHGCDCHVKAAGFIEVIYLVGRLAAFDVPEVAGFAVIREIEGVFINRRAAKLVVYDMYREDVAYAFVVEALQFRIHQHSVRGEFVKAAEVVYFEAEYD